MKLSNHLNNYIEFILLYFCKDIPKLKFFRLIKYSFKPLSVRQYILQKIKVYYNLTLLSIYYINKDIEKYEKENNINFNVKEIQLYE